MANPSDDPLEGLEERLANHAKAFDSLLALTPAREYYGSQIDDGLDPSEQWNRKKQTKEQKRAAKKAKLDPANQKSALDVMKEREKKRKRELGMEEQADDPAESAGPKVQKQELDADAVEAKKRAVNEKRRESRQRKQEKMARVKAKLEAKSEAKKTAKQNERLAEAQPDQPPASMETGEVDEEDQDEEHDAEPTDSADLENLDLAGLADSEQADEDAHVASQPSSVPTSPVLDSPAFDVATNHSDASSSSSITPASVADEEKQSATRPQLELKPSKTDAQPATLSSASTKPLDSIHGTSSPKLQLPKGDQAELQERLRKRIEELRARRKADAVDGKPARSRQELLEQRRKKEEQRKVHKKELRRQAKEEEDRKREEQLRGSGSPLSADFFNMASSKPQENNFSFSRLAFEDGTTADASLTGLQDARKKKGPQDPKTALEAAQKKQSRLSGLDAEKRADIAEKDMWLNAKKRAHGERVRDDTSLLKKALKRQEKAKGKSEKEWKEREQAVVKGREMKQKKREGNLQKRREEKGAKGSKKKKSGGSAGGKGSSGGKKKGRPGFEGRFKA